MGELYAYGSEVTSVFQLIGTLEDDITKSIASAARREVKRSQFVFTELRKR